MPCTTRAWNPSPHLKQARAATDHTYTHFPSTAHKSSVVVSFHDIGLLRRNHVKRLLHQSQRKRAAYMSNLSRFTNGENSARPITEELKCATLTTLSLCCFRIVRFLWASLSSLARTCFLFLSEWILSLVCYFTYLIVATVIPLRYNTRRFHFVTMKSFLFLAALSQLPQNHVRTYPAHLILKWNPQNPTYLANLFSQVKQREINHAHAVHRRK